MKDLAMEAAQQRMAMRGVSETRMTQENQQNAGGVRRLDGEGNPYYDEAPRTEYPRMLYRATEHEQTQEWADAVGGLKDAPMVINRFDGLLCETTIAHDAREAEALSANGWDVSPKAAHGIEDGLVAATTAKDDRIAELEAMLAAQAAQPPEKRGPGRPPKVDTVQPQA